MLIRRACSDSEDSSLESPLQLCPSSLYPVRPWGQGAPRRGLLTGYCLCAPEEVKAGWKHCQPLGIHNHIGRRAVIKYLDDSDFILNSACSLEQVVVLG